MSRKPHRGISLVLALVTVSLPFFNRVAQAADITWTNPAGGDWFDPANWNSGAGPVPGSGDVAHITMAGDYAVLVAYTGGITSVTIGGLEVGAASGSQRLEIVDPSAGARLAVPFTINGPATVNANGLVGLKNIIVEGPGDFTLAGHLLVGFESQMRKNLDTAVGSRITMGPFHGDGSGDLTVTDGFTNRGTITFTSNHPSYPNGQLTVTNGTLVSAPGATIDIQAGTIATLRAELDNQGTVTVNGAFDISRHAQADHLNSGVINVTGANMQILQMTGTVSSFTNTGAITVDTGRSLTINQGTVNQNAGSISGAGTLRLAGGLSANWNTPFQLASLYMNAAALTLTSDFSTASSELEMWNAGLYGAVTVTNAPGHTVQVYNACTIGTTALVNQGTLRMNDVSITAAFSNTAGAVFRVEGGVTVASGFTNLGTIELPLYSTLNVTTGTLVNEVGATITSIGGENVLQTAFDNRGTVTVGAKLTMGRTGANNLNSGTIDVSGGDLRIILNAGSLTNTGTIPVSAGRTLTTNEGNLIQSSGSISGAGTLHLNYTGTTFNAPVAIAALSMFGASAVLTSDLSTANTSLSLVHSSLHGSVTVTNAAGKTSTWQGATIHTALTNQGTLIAGAVVNGALTTAVGSVIQLTPSEQFHVANGFTNLGLIDMARGTVFRVTAGTLVNAAGATIKTADVDQDMAYLEATLDNQGTLTVNSKLTLERPAGSHVNSGAINVSGADFTSRQWAGGSFANSGTITVAAGRTYHSTEGTFTNTPTGHLLGTGTYNFGTTLINQGTIAPGASPGILAITGDATFSGGALDIELGGLTVGTQYDRLNVSGAASFDGTLRVTLLDGFCTSPGDQFQIVVSGSRIGTFDSIEVLGPGNPVFNAQYTANGLTLVTTTNLLTVNATAGANGSISPSGGVQVACGADQTFMITPAPCYHIVDVIVDGNSMGPITSHTFNGVIEDHTISATFAIDTYSIGASAGSNGSISPSGDNTVNCGSDQTFMITPAHCYHVADVLVDGNSVGAVTSHTFTNVQANHTISATFAINTYSINASAGANGSISPVGGSVVNCGSDLNVMITPNACYHVADVLVDGNSVGAVTSHTFTNVQANHTISASFAINMYTINASAGSGGTIDPVGAVAATCGSNRSFDITPGSGFAVANVLVDGSPVGAVTSHTFTNVVANHTIAASFVDVAAPSVAVIAPNGGEYWHGPRLIRWTASDNVVVDSVDVAYSVHGPGGPWVNILQSGSPPDSVEWTPPDECGDSALVRITCYDPTGNTGSDVSDGMFHLRCTPLAIGEGSAPSLALQVPNPVHGGRVHMRVSLPAAARATLDILAVTGQRVWSTQLDGSPGVHNLIWDGRADHSGVVEPGVYFARLVTPLGGRSVRFVLLR